MAKISYLEALKNPSCRQKYLEWLVETSGLNFPYVDEFKYINNEEAIKIKDRICTQNISELEHITVVCTPNGRIPANSTIYFTENNFSDNCKKLIQHSVVSQNDFEICQKIELCYHEAVHSEHFGRGIEGFNLEEFKLETEEGKKLFLIASEIDAHTKHIQKLGYTKINSIYLRNYQKFLIGMFAGYMRLLTELVKKGYDEKLPRKIFERYKELKYNQLQG